MSKASAKKIFKNSIPVVVVSIFVIAPAVYGYWAASVLAAGLGGFAVSKLWNK